MKKIIDKKYIEFKKLTSTQVIICLICFLVAFFITVQVRTIDKSESDILRLKKENELRDEIEQWKSMYNTSATKINELNKKIEDYRADFSSTDDKIALIKKELDTANVLAGTCPVKGKGITIKLDDTAALEQIAIDAGYYDRNVFIIHDTDLLSVINELAAAGAEAFSINGQRIISASAIRCVGPVVQINGVSIAAPFVISAIGEPDTLVGALNLRGGIISELKNSKIDVTVERKEEVVIPAYDKVIENQYATPVKEEE